MKDYYEILGIERSADKKTIRNVYRKLVKLYHPDLNPSGASKFEEISQAYFTLLHPDKRAEYDRKLNEERANANAWEKISFSFREFSKWLYERPFVKKIFSKKTVAQTDTLPEYLLKMNPDELFQRVVYSNNVFVQMHAVRALLEMMHGQDPVGRFLKLLYSGGISEAVKLEIVDHLTEHPDERIVRALSEVYEAEKSLRLRRAIRQSLSARDNLFS